MPCHHRKETATPPSDGDRLPVIFSSLRAAHNRQLDQLDAAARKVLLDSYRRLKPELVAKLKALDEAGLGETFTAQHLALIQFQITDALATWAPAAAAALTVLTDQAATFGATTAIAEVADLERRFVDAEAAARIAAVPPIIPVDQVARIGDAQNLLLNKFADEAVNGTVQDATQLPGIADKLAESVALGESIPKAAKRLGQALDAEAWKLKRIARTEIAQAANDSHEAQIEGLAIAFPDMGLKKQWSAATCDPRTCPVCQELDGQVVGYDADFVYLDPAGKRSWRGKAPPQHPNCRCRVNAYRAEWAVKPAKAPPKHHPRRRRKESRMAQKSAPGREVKNLPLSEFKMLDEAAGTFTGYAAVYGNIDSYGDIIQPGAFKDWLAAAQRAGKKIPILWQHDSEEVIGVCAPADLEEDAHGLRVKKATLVLSVQRAAEARDLMLVEAIDSLSIGYSVDEKATPPKGHPARRFLVKLTLWEFSPVTFPANPLAAITGAKGKPPAGKAADFATTLDLNQREESLWERRWALSSALGQVIGSALCDRELARDDAMALVETSLEQFGEAMLAWFSDALDLEEAERAADQKAGAKPGTKAGKTISAATLKAIDEAMGCYDKGTELHAVGRKKLAALIGKKDEDTPDDGGDAGDDTPDDETDSTKAMAGLVDEMKATNFWADVRPPRINK